MSAFCNKYPECGCVDVGTKCYSADEFRALTGAEFRALPKQAPGEQLRKMAALEAALQLDGVPAEPKPLSRNKPCPCRSGKNYKNCHGK